MLQKFHCEHVLDILGAYCPRHQTRLLVWVLLPFSVLMALSTNNLHLDVMPDHWCRVSYLVNFSYGEQHRLIRPPVPMIIGGYQTPEKLSQCEMYDIDYGLVVSQLEVNQFEEADNGSSLYVPTRKCSHGWVYDRGVYGDSAAMQYDFVCDNAWQIDRIKKLKNISSISFAIIFGVLVDRTGRKVGFLVLMFSYLLSSVPTLLHRHYGVFLFCELLAGATHPMALMLLLIYTIESTSPERRAASIIYIGLFYHLGQCGAAAMAKYIAHWWYITCARVAYLVICLAMFIFASDVCFDETSHWLVATKNSSALKLLLNKLNRLNRADLEPETIDSIVSKLLRYPFEKTNDNEDGQKQQQQQPQQQPQEETQAKEPCGRKLLTLSEYLKFKQHPAAAAKVEETREDNNNETSSNRLPSSWANIKLFMKRSTLAPLVLVFSIMLATNELVIDGIGKRLVRPKEVDQVLFDHALQSLIRIPLLLFTSYLINQRIGRRWSNCLVLAINLGLLVAIAVFDRQLRKHVLANVTISTLSTMMAECSIIITALQVIELSPTRYRTTIAMITYVVGHVIFMLLIIPLQSHKLRVLLNFYTKMIIYMSLTMVSILIGSFVAETRQEFLPTGLLTSEQLITNVTYWSMAKKRSDVTPSNLQLTLSKWDINLNHQIHDDQDKQHLARQMAAIGRSRSIQIVTNL